MRIWRRINIILATIVLLLAVAAGIRLGFTYWSSKAIQPDKTIIGTPTVATSPSTSQKLKIGAFRYYRSQDFLARPTLVVSYQLTNAGKTAALPQYVFDNNVTYVQQTNAGTSSILAATTVANSRLSFLNRNYRENAQILLRAGENVRVLGTYRLESLNRPITMMVGGKKRMMIQPWTLKVVAAE